MLYLLSLVNFFLLFLTIYYRKKIVNWFSFFIKIKKRSVISNVFVLFFAYIFVFIVAAIPIVLYHVSLGVSIMNIIESDASRFRISKISLLLAAWTSVFLFLSILSLFENYHKKLLKVSRESVVEKGWFLWYLIKICIKYYIIFIVFVFQLLISFVSKPIYFLSIFVNNNNKNIRSDI